ncbi:MAG TPA: M23 family metallopeptidase [Candidatus Polarisedimenticolaceae bacterium]|nr:M23 family metallopeptidase [Candidatus Polarisedimenticolaceae bacterium]
MARGKSSRLLRRFLILVALAGLAFLGLAGFRAGPAPVVEIEAGLPGIGKRTPFTIVVREPTRGLSAVRVELVQGERVELLEERSYEPRQPWEFWGPRDERDEIRVEVGSETIKGLEPGEAELRVVADRAPAWLSRPAPMIDGLTLPVKLRPPTLQIVSRHTYVDQGGSEAVIYKVGASSIRDGVQAGEWFFPGYPLPGGQADDRFAWFGVPFDMGDASDIKLIATDDVNNLSHAPFIDQFRPKPFRNDTITLSDSFMERVVPAILAQSPEIEDRGDLLQNYLAVNGELRRLNAEALVELSRQSVLQFLWDEHFIPMRNAKVMSNFADRRSYLSDGETVDRQDHLGYDLASTALAEIQAANDGVVVMARYFGIYGNTVVIDHGYGLLSLYGHLSSIEVEAGQSVERGQAIGRSGATGLAGGDHLHFTMLLHGLPVNPSEWWDAHWIHDRLKLKLGDALPFDD